MPTYQVNGVGVAKARELIDAEQYALDSEGSDALPDTDAENAQLFDRHGYDGYGLWHLAIDPERGRRSRSATRSSTATSTACTAAG